MNKTRFIDFTQPIPEEKISEVQNETELVIRVLRLLRCIIAIEDDYELLAKMNEFSHSLEKRYISFTLPSPNGDYPLTFSFVKKSILDNTGYHKILLGFKLLEVGSLRCIKYNKNLFKKHKVYDYATISHTVLLDLKTDVDETIQLLQTLLGKL